MTKRTLMFLLMVGFIVGILGGGYAVVVTNGGAQSTAETPSGFIH